MEGVVFALLSILMLFFVLLGVKELFFRRSKKKFCVMCASVFLTWVLLLLLFWSGSFFDKTIIAILLGSSSTGLYYLWERNVREETKVFRLPILITLIYVSYSFIEGFTLLFGLIPLFTWGLFLIIFSFTNEGKLGEFARKIVECCKD